MDLQMQTEKREEIKNIYYAIKSLSNYDILNCPIDSILPYYNKLLDIKMDIIDTQSAKIVKKEIRFANTIKVLSDFVYLFGLRRELEVCKKIINSDNPWSEFNSFEFYHSYVGTCEMEISGAMLKKGDTVVHLGSGPLPISLILFSELFEINCIGIEQEELCYQSSLEVIEALNIGDKVKIISGNHFSFPIKHDFDHLIIGLDAKPKNEIFKHLAENLKKGTSVSYRFKSQSEKGEIYLTQILNNHQDNFQVYPNFDIFRIIQAKPPVVNSIAFAKLV